MAKADRELEQARADLIKKLAMPQTMEQLEILERKIELLNLLDRKE